MPLNSSGQLTVYAHEHENINSVPGQEIVLPYFQTHYSYNEAHELIWQVLLAIFLTYCYCTKVHILIWQVVLSTFMNPLLLYLICIIPNILNQFVVQCELDSKRKCIYSDF